MLTKQGWINASGTILLQISPPHPLLAAGQTLRVLGMLGRPAHATNPGEFDSADFYRMEQRRILTSMRITRLDNIEILSDPGPGLIGWMREWARDLLAMGLRPGKEVGRILEAIRVAQLEGVVQTRAEALEMARRLANEGTGPLPPPPA